VSVIAVDGHAFRRVESGAGAAHDAAQNEVFGEVAAQSRPRPEPAAPLLKVQGLRVQLAGGADVVSDVSFEVAAGRIIGLVGESGSGKTTVASALLGHVRHGARIVEGRIEVAGTDLLSLDEDALRTVRGRVVAHVAQDPATTLNPLLRIGTHMHEVLEVHAPALDRAAREARILDVFADVGLPAEAAFLKRFPHQLSGGQQQRVLLAQAFVLKPRLIVLDEPTTALDVSTQARVLATIRRLCSQHGVAAVYVSHDLAVVRELVDDVIVLYAGRIAEAAPLATLFDAPAHPYSQGLLAAIPDVAERRALQPIPGQAPAPGTRPAGCAFAPRCPLADARCGSEQPALSHLHGGQQAACLKLDAGPAFRIEAAASARRPTAEADGPPLLEVAQIDAWFGSRQVLHNVALRLGAGECVAVVGESGSGKTTLARALAGLGEHAAGSVLYRGQSLSLHARERTADVRHQIQYIFQNPYRALNPRHRVGETLTAAVRHFFGVDRAEARRRAEAVMARVSLQPGLLDAYPRELSGGERQRVAIARALVCEPQLLICDEITSALDVSVQATILALLRELQAGGLSILFVTHDLGVVRALADRVVVLREGRVVEHGAVDDVLDHPFNRYTKQLVEHSPSLIDAAHRPPREDRVIRYSI
jgi:peptide/nickel transport system ATP-binding protein